MGRRKRVYTREYEPDFKYNNIQVGRFINYVMRDGKKAAASKVVYGAFDIIEEKTKQNPVEVFEEAVNKVAPILEIKSKRVGGATYQVPVEVRGGRRMLLAFRWMIDAANGRKGRPMAEKLAAEILDINSGTGAAIKKREDVQKMAESNRAFAHFA
ncbi:MAG: 30S ribosomal protein S7 [Candidatus Pacebacteria bacterium]|nr:30S ribosomal protein S7 [Candidatus Paceibacterota bacterium]